MLKDRNLPIVYKKFGIFTKMTTSSFLLFCLPLAPSLAFFMRYISPLPNNQLLLFVPSHGSPLFLIPSPSAPAPPPFLLSGLVMFVSEYACG